MRPLRYAKDVQPRRGVKTSSKRSSWASWGPSWAELVLSWSLPQYQNSTDLMNNFSRTSNWVSRRVGRKKSRACLWKLGDAHFSYYSVDVIVIHVSCFLNIVLSKIVHANMYSDVCNIIMVSRVHFSIKISGVSWAGSLFLSWLVTSWAGT